jgi:ABC-2 type transport system ATP-binding protein
MNAVVEVRQLTKRYGSLSAVGGVSFYVEEGEVFGILGPNGAGKTTTVEIIEGLRRPESGSVSVLGMDPQTEGRAIKERIGVQLQSATLYDRIRVREAVDLFAGYYQSAVPTGTLLEEFALVDKEDAFVGKLSGGQQQRLALALALVNDPSLVFLDEPTTGLDPQARRNMWDIIRSLQERGKTTVLTTHYMEEAEELCHRVAILDHGKIIALDTPNGLVSAANLKSRVEVGAVGEALRKAIEEAGLPATAVHAEGKLILHTTEPSNVLTRLAQIAAEQGAALESLTVKKATLEEVFLSLTGRHLRE